MEQLINTVSSAAHGSEVWIGLYSNNVYQWSDRFNGGGYRKWGDQEPDWVEYQLCVRSIIGFGWCDSSCTALYPFICNKGKTPFTFRIISQFGN